MKAEKVRQKLMRKNKAQEEQQVMSQSLETRLADLSTKHLHMLRQFHELKQAVSDKDAAAQELSERLRCVLEASARNKQAITEAEAKSKEQQLVAQKIRESLERHRVAWQKEFAELQLQNSLYIATLQEKMDQMERAHRTEVEQLRAQLQQRETVMCSEVTRLDEPVLQDIYNPVKLEIKDEIDVFEENLLEMDTSNPSIDELSLQLNDTRSKNQNFSYSGQELSREGLQVTRIGSLHQEIGDFKVNNIFEDFDGGECRTSSSILLCKFCKMVFTDRSIFEGHQPVCLHRPFKENISVTKSDRLQGASALVRSISGNFFGKNINLVEHSGSHPFNCAVCGKSFVRKCRLIEHTRIHTGDRRFNCSICCKSFTWKRNLVQHCRTHTGYRPFICTICGESYARKVSLVEHSMTHTGDTPFKCSTCGKSFIRKSGLVEHNRIHTGESPFNCKICGKSFIRKRSLVEHCMIHTGDRPFICEICGKSFARKKYFVGHNKTHVNDSLFNCKICGKSFVRKSYLVQHSITHKSYRPFNCTICGKSFMRKKGLVEHNITHTGGRPFKCKICGKSFKRQSSLTVHNMTHTVDHPFKCKVCVKSFARQSCLIEHNKTHTSDRPFKCTICGKSFVRKSGLVEHCKTHSSDRFNCLICGKYFEKRTNLVEHIIITHTGASPSGAQYEVNRL